MSSADKVELSHDEFLDALFTQIHLLDKSCRDFDEGDHDEALRIAVALRVLLHDGRYTCLLRELGVIDELLFTNTHHPAPPGPNTFDPGLLQIGLQAPQMSARLVPHLANGPMPSPSFIPFDQWWSADEPIRSNEGFRFTREFLVTRMANTRGAHVDRLLDSRFARLGSDHLGITYRSATTGGEARPVTGDVARLSLRQIAWEVRDTLNRNAMLIWADHTVPPMPEPPVGTPLNSPEVAAELQRMRAAGLSLEVEVFVGIDPPASE